MKIKAKGEKTEKKTLYSAIDFATAVLKHENDLN